MKKILFLVNNYPPTVCGVGDYTFMLSKELIKKGYDVHIVFKSSYSNTDSEISTRFHPVKKWNLFGYYKVFQTVKKIRPDWLFVQYVPYSFNSKGISVLFSLLLLILSFTTKILVTFHEVRIKINFKRLSSLLYGLPMWLISRLVYIISDVSVTSNSFYSNLISSNKSKLHIVRVGSNITMNFSSNYNIGALKSKLCLHDTFVLGIFGMNMRGVSVILDVITEMNSRGTSVTLLLMGQISPRVRSEILDKARALDIDKNIVFTGHIDLCEVVNYFRLVDLYCMLEPTQSVDTWNGTSTRSGTFAAAVLADLPVIGTRGELCDDFVEKICIKMLNNLNREELMEAILDFINNNVDFIKHLGDIDYLKRELRWDFIANRYIDIIKNSTSGKYYEK